MNNCKISFKTTNMFLTFKTNENIKQLGENAFQSTNVVMLRFK